MSHIDLISALAQEVQRDRLEDGRTSRLAAIARCCRPSRWRRLGRTTLAAARGVPRRHTPPPAVCC